MAKLQDYGGPQQAPPIKWLKAACVQPGSQNLQHKTVAKALPTSHGAYCCKQRVTAEGDLDECIWHLYQVRVLFHLDYDSWAVEDTVKRGCRGLLKL